ncbi:Elongator complex protein 4 [Nakaseomyces bracarensis]|uniref:Elongator complex protein 4 n=1 Tax=Nakaseomyces bracarensis TaxID=273131 RepID=A0ABR4NU34_9SACH
MSFRKRGEVLNGGRSGTLTNTLGRAPNGATPGRTPVTLGRAPVGTGRTPVVGAGRTTAIGRGAVPVVRGASPGVSGVADKLASMDVTDATEASSGLGSSHPGVRPSPASSQPTTSTGCSDLDKVLGHMGLPLGCTLLIKEQGSTEFNSILVKLMCAQGIVHNRLEDDKTRRGNTHLIVLSLNQSLGKELPGIYKGSKREVKKTKISEEQSKISVQNLSEQPQKERPHRYKDLKIAWKYKYVDEQRGVGNEKSEITSSEYKDYNHQFDITSRLLPAPTSSELTFVNPTQPVHSVINQIEKVIELHDHKLIRIVVPSILHPAMYPPRMFQLSEILLLLHGLYALVKKYGDRCVLMGTLSSDIIDPFLLSNIENLFDSALTLEPFGQEMMQFLERVYKTQPGKIQHGLLHVMKLPVFSERGEMHVMRSELAFKNGRKKFEIEEWGIPVDDVDDADDKNKSKDLGNAHGMENSQVTAPKKQTKVELDY